MESPCSPLTADFFMKWFEELAIRTAHVKPSFWGRYVDDTLVVIKKDSIDEFMQHINSIHSATQFTVENYRKLSCGCFGSYILTKHGTAVHFKPQNTLRSLLVAPKDKTSSHKCSGTKLVAKTVLPTYVNESGRPLGIRIKEH